MREERLVIRPFEEIRIINYESVQEANEHARAKVTGWIPFKNRDDYIKAGRRQTWVQVTALSEEGEIILFYGLIEQLCLKIENGTCMMEMNLCSGTQLMDYENHTRSFQDKAFTFRDLLDTCIREYEDSGRIMTEGKEKTIQNLIMQYRETDWEFIKRLASMNHTMLFADCSTKGEKFYFGIPNRTDVQEPATDEYQMRCEIEEYWAKRGRDLEVRTEDTVSYIWESREFHRLGEKAVINHIEGYIWKIQTKLRGNEVYHTCYMKPRPGLRTFRLYNESLTGVSLPGTVTKVQNEKVQIRIHSDENKEGAGVRWYSYSTVYSSQDGTGWYCMPEIGDTVRLYFPGDREEDAYVASAYHESGSALRTRPERKFWRNKEGKEIRLSPDSILLTNNDGTYIELSDDNGIEMISNGSISLRAGGNLSISSSGSSIEMNAPNRIRLKQGDTEMDLGGDLSMSGARIRL